MTTHRPAAVPGRPAVLPAPRRLVRGQPERRGVGQGVEQSPQVDPGPGRVRDLDAGVVLLLIEPADPEVLTQDPGSPITIRVGGA